MDDSLAANILAALDILIAERVAPFSLHALEPVPQFFKNVAALLSPGGSSILDYEQSAFLAQFVEEAEEFWQLDQTGCLKSDPWSESYRDDKEYFFVAQAITVKQRKLLVVELLNGGVEHGRRLLQSARETALSYRQEQKKAEASERAKRDFLSQMSHEIRTPVTGIIGNLELVLSTDLTDQQAAYLNAVEVSANSLMALIDDILDLSRIDAQKLELAEEEFSLSECVNETITMLSQRASSKGLEMVCRIEDGAPDSVVGDLSRIRQIVMNLVSNAIKFTKQGRILVSVQVESLSEQDAQFHFSVSDTGIGIPPELLDKVFDPFEQADASVTRNYGGTGLGLAICARLVRMMGGRIWVESEVGQGSTFHFLIPLRRGHGVFRRPGRTKLPWSQPPPKAMVVCTSSEAGNTLRRVAEDQGFKAITVSDVQGALRALEEALNKEQTIDFLIVEHQPPEMDCSALAERLRSISLGADTHVLAVVPPGVALDRKRAEESGVAAVFDMPVTGEELAQTVSGLRNKRPGAPNGDRPGNVSNIQLGSRSFRILLAEDNLINREMVRNILQKMGHQITTAGNGKEALAAVQNGAFDLIFMDVAMPEMDGTAATAAIREMEKTSGGHVPIVAMTAYAVKGDKERFLAGGMDDYVSKPIRSRVMAEVIERVMDKTKVPTTDTEQSSVPGGVFDRAKLLEHLDKDTELLDSVVTLYLREYPPALSAIEHAVSTGDSVDLSRSAHKLKGMLLEMQAHLASEAAARLESIGRTGIMTEAAPEFTTLVREIERVQRALVEQGLVRDE